VSGAGKIRVVLAGPYPAAGGMTGTYGRILENLRTSAVFADEIEFIPHRETLPADGNAVKRTMVDFARSVRSLRRRPDILHILMQKYRGLYREFPFLEMARALGVKTVVDIRAGTLQQMLQSTGTRPQNAMMRRLLRRGDAVVLECLKDVAFVRESFGREGLYLPNVALAMDVERIRPNPDRPGPGRPIRLIHSGRYSADKGTGILLEALQILSRRGIEAELHLTGQGKEPEILDQIRRNVESPPPGIPVIDHGWDVPDLYALLASAHVLVMPTTWFGEGHPNAVTEAMMAGLGMVLTDWTHREGIVPEGGALFVEPGDPAEVAEAVERYAKEPGLLEAARKANRRQVEERFLDRVCYPRLLELYRELGQRDRSPDR
jgi:glycosyltransferase involved in cell wall biosynthesis